MSAAAFPYFVLGQLKILRFLFVFTALVTKSYKNINPEAEFQGSVYILAELQIIDPVITM